LQGRWRALIFFSALTVWPGQELAVSAQQNLGEQPSFRASTVLLTTDAVATDADGRHVNEPGR
jgi:hypothetical protein